MRCLVVDSGKAFSRQTWVKSMKRTGKLKANEVMVTGNLVHTNDGDKGLANRSSFQPPAESTEKGKRQAMARTTTMRWRTV